MTNNGTIKAGDGMDIELLFKAAFDRYASGTDSPEDLKQINISVTDTTVEVRLDNPVNRIAVQRAFDSSALKETHQLNLIEP
ncbi:MAG: hypothetical protein AAF609_27220 [Cyanobacteria bacterium P01_C01_bin.120]